MRPGRPVGPASRCSTSAAMSRKPMRRARNASTATSLAAFRMVGAPPPARKASRARRRRGSGRSSGAAKSSRATAARSSRGRGGGQPLRPGQVWAMGMRMSGLPSWARDAAVAVVAPCRARRIADWISTSTRDSGRPEQPGGLDQLQALVEHGGGVDADLAAHRPDRVAQARPPASPSRISASGLAVRNGPPEAVRTMLLDRAAVVLGHRLEDRIVFRVDRQAAWHRHRARPGASVSPAHTSASLLANAITPPRRIAASVAGRPAAPVIAAIVQSTRQSEAAFDDGHQARRRCGCPGGTDRALPAGPRAATGR